MLEIIINKKAAEMLHKSFPWVMRGDLLSQNSALKLADKGELVRITDNKGRFVAKGFYNPDTNIAARVLSSDPNKKIDEKFFSEKFRKALERRFKYFEDGFFRLTYGESDGLPGLITDLYGEYAVVQVNSAGMARLKGHWLTVLIDMLKLKGVYLDASNRHREREGLDSNSGMIYGDVPKIIEIRENGISYFANLYEGQKTGWFYDQRDNRRYLASKAEGKSFLDLYSYSGGFGLLAAAYGANYIVLVDRSELALELAEEGYTTPYHSERYILESKSLRSSSSSKVTQNIKFIKSDVFDYLDNNDETGFDIVNADPPAFIKSRKDVTNGLKGYEKLVRKSLPFVNEGGLFAISSCSYFVRPEQFRNTIEAALEKSGRKFELVKKAGADKDHPIHPMLGETNYLKFLVYRLEP